MSPAPSSDTTNVPLTDSDNNSDVFQLVTLSSDTFVVPSTFAQRISQSCSTNTVFTGKVTCSAPFTSTDGGAFLAVGCAEGLWIGSLHESQSLRRVLPLKMVTQCATLEAFRIFLVLTEKALFAYDVDALVASYLQPTEPSSYTPLKLSGEDDVQFFSLGSLEGRTLVAYMKKKGIADSVFRVLEPISGSFNEGEKDSFSDTSSFGLRQLTSECFRVYSEFYIPVEAYDVIFLTTKIAILCKKRFEVMDLSDFTTVTIPQYDDSQNKKLSKRCESSRPMGIFRSGKDEYLLCYDKFGLYVDRHGDPNLTKGTIEWEGTADHVAWHPPYVLIFKSHSIEVRLVDTGRLCQIIRGQDLQCTWDGCRSLIQTVQTLSPDSNGTWDETPVQGEHVHGVMRADDGSQGRAGSFDTAGGVKQNVFALIPTIRKPISLEDPAPPTQH